MEAVSIKRETSWVGRKLGGYRIEARIGDGGMATVYQAFQPQLERRVAIKVLKSREEQREAFLARFHREAKRIAALRHPNILTIYDYGEVDGMAYIVMEYIAGGTVKELLTGRAIAWSDASTFVVPVARSLAYAHSRNIIHCDVKPANILLPRADWPLLADFGLSRLQGVREEGDVAGVLTGTPGYVSPEQLIGKILTQRSDIYSLGTVIYELVTGTLPFEADSPARLLMMRLTEDPVPPSERNPRVDKKLEEIIMSTLARDPDERCPDMVTLLRSLIELPGSVVSSSLRPSTHQATGGTNALMSHKTVNGAHLIVTGTESIVPLPVLAEVLVGRRVPRAAKQPEVDLGPHGGAEAGVSRHHARLHHTDQGWFLEDLNSTNGTSLNMAPVRPGDQLKLQNGDVVRCGRLMFVFYEE